MNRLLIFYAIKNATPNATHYIQNSYTSYSKTIIHFCGTHQRFLESTNCLQMYMNEKLLPQRCAQQYFMQYKIGLIRICDQCLIGQWQEIYNTYRRLCQGDIIFINLTVRLMALRMSPLHCMKIINYSIHKNYSGSSQYPIKRGHL